jgi:hypothetical protein
LSAFAFNTEAEPAHVASRSARIERLPAVLPFEYSVPELVIRQEFGGSVNRPLKMSQQPELTSPPLPASPAPAPEVAMDVAQKSPAGEIMQGSGYPPQRIPHWLVRTELYLRVLLRLYIGIAICIAPWWPLLWDQNPLFVQFPTLAIYAANGAVRGVITGLGLLNIWIAVQDAIRHRNG